MDSLTKHYRTYLEQTTSVSQVLSVLNTFKAITAEVLQKRYNWSDRAVSNQLNVSNTVIGRWKKKAGGSK